MSNWSLQKLLEELHKDIEHKLSTVRSSICHPGAKGDGSEKVWLDLLGTYLPKRYEVANAFIVDSKGVFSDQIDVVVFDRQYSPLVFQYQYQTIIPAESVYAVFEAKQSISSKTLKYAQDKVRSVRKLHRTTLPIVTADGELKPKAPIPIIGGILTLESDWSPALGDSLRSQLTVKEKSALLDIGCIASHGYFYTNDQGEEHEILTKSRAATAFLFKLISKLQLLGTVSSIDVQAYGNWLLDQKP